MGLAYFLVLDNGSCTDGGKAIAHLADSLNEACRGLGLPSLEDYIYVDPEDLEFLGEDPERAPDPSGARPPDGTWPEEPWFEPVEGLDYFNALRDHVRANPAPFDDPAWGPALAEDLEECIESLESARSNGRRWHLAIDM